MKLKILLPLIASISLITSQSFAAFTPLSVAIVPPIQFPPEDFSITGLRLSALWGQHRDVYGVDLGLLGNITDQDFVGIGVSGVFNATYGNTRIIGLQLAGMGNYNKQKTSVVGLQAALMTNYNVAESSVYGVQLSLANISAFTAIYGLQLGLYNRAKSVYGFQIGLINVTDNLHGLQIGLVNMNNTGPFKISPILNVGF
ncbi:LA_2272 family surface repeat-containing protein [Bdellovibrio sp. HCB288]|uniref:LA_2272 family surface repeat-containing protein n=1 Tax=Bdellovibrio sp. HCB288 TaxID=3394355 RepID=UPI0039B42357